MTVIIDRLLIVIMITIIIIIIIIIIITKKFIINIVFPLILSEIFVNIFQGIF